MVHGGARTFSRLANRRRRLEHLKMVPNDTGGRRSVAAWTAPRSESGGSLLCCRWRAIDHSATECTLQLVANSSPPGGPIGFPWGPSWTRLGPFCKTMKTSHIRAADVEERWYIFDASEFTLGRMASDIAMRLMGKDRPTYTPSELSGAHVVVINAEKAVVTGKKETDKEYQRYSGYPGGLYIRNLETLRERKPNDIVKLAVRRMLPKNRLGKNMLSRMKVYSGTEHPHSAQSPQKVEKLLR